MQCSRCEQGVSRPGLCADCRSTVFRCECCKRQIEGGAGLCIDCFNKNAQPCERCKTRFTTFRNGLCSDCFKSVSYVCDNCEGPVNTPGLCESCKPKLPCLVCKELTTYNSQICKKCFDKKCFKCENCSVKIQRPKFCKNCFQSRKNPKMM